MKKNEIQIQQEKDRIAFEKRFKKIGNKNEKKIAIDILRGRF